MEDKFEVSLYISLVSNLHQNQTLQPPSHANLEVLKKKPRKTWGQFLKGGITLFQG